MDLQQGLGLLEQLIGTHVHEDNHEQAKAVVSEAADHHAAGTLDLNTIANNLLPKLGELVQGDGLKQIESVLTSLIGGGK